MKRQERESEAVELRRHLRAVCQFFRGLNERTPKGFDNAYDNEGANFLTDSMVNEIRAFLVEKDADNGDLMAIRQKPFEWCFPDPDPYQWLWILQRYTNRYA